MSTDEHDAKLWRLAQAHKMIRMGLVTVDDDGQLVPTQGMADMDPGPIEPDPIDLAEVARRFS